MRRRRSVRVVCLVAVVAGLATACVSPPDGGPSEYACGDAPVSLGAGSRIRGVSADGNVVVAEVFHETPEGTGHTFVVIDRDAGTRVVAATASPDSDGAEVRLDRTGTRVAFRFYEDLPGGTWHVYDIPSATTAPLDVVGTDGVSQFSADLRAAVVGTAGSPGYQRIDLTTGARQDLVVPDLAGQVLLEFSPDLSLALYRSTGSNAVKTATVVDTSTGAIVRQVGPFHNESQYATYVRFLDDRTVLVDNAVPLGAPSDGIADDGAFLTDVASGATIRLDPDVPNASTSSATPDGARSTFAVIRAQQSWIHVPPAAPELVAEGFAVVTDADLDVAVFVRDAELFVRCY